MNNTVELYGKTFDVVKLGRSNWQTEYHKAVATHGISKSDAIEALKQVNKDDLLKGCDSCAFIAIHVL